MKYFIIAFMAAIGWNVGVLVYNIIERSLYKYIPRKKHNRRGRVVDYGYKSK